MFGTGTKSKDIARAEKTEETTATETEKYG